MTTTEQGTRYRLVLNTGGYGDDLTQPRPHIVLDTETGRGSRYATERVARSVYTDLSSGRSTPRMCIWSASAGEAARTALGERAVRSRDLGIGDGPHLHFERGISTVLPEPAPVPPAPFEVEDVDGDELKVDFDGSRRFGPSLLVEATSGADTAIVRLSEADAVQLADKLHDFADYIRAEKARAKAAGRYRVLNAGALGDWDGFKVPATPAVVDVETGGVDLFSTVARAREWVSTQARPIPARPHSALMRSVFPPSAVRHFAGHRAKTTGKSFSVRDTHEAWLDASPEERDRWHWYAEVVRAARED